ncbi:30S ribosomal subunit protein S16 [Wigglesworthia glossinidia endosymbiont of Glossina morsitans morsitans (Yale colony)]|uniref:Small ribosomal subunit protein bS16 n=1 Tax=Wigglesworthia glossinidia endosymbiont of Glossina morsitans morsitans (Yale colony) TaxID=1142511 RepID=H6Q568_WIGGL|nr:30S ribosomal protein S16 [Wigglesworthia glossinidia]AFA41351.1 30S ribosomal subunit protein S16 [Wigglesworthia glossinidia endosymbiont of Glossina morsitans morsitans (Yale colony)]
MVIIRLSRKGSRNKPFYQVIVSDSRKPRDGKFIERLGFLNPIPSGKSIAYSLKINRINFWIQKGAQISNRVKKLISQYKK